MIGVRIPAEGSWKYKGWCLKRRVLRIYFMQRVTIGRKEVKEFKVQGIETTRLV